MYPAPRGDVFWSWPYVLLWMIFKLSFKCTVCWNDAHSRMLQTQSILRRRGTIAAGAFHDHVTNTPPLIVYTCVSQCFEHAVTLPLHFSFIPCASGGKDSCYNMMQCVTAGHRIVALANLRPANTGNSNTRRLYVIHRGSVLQYRPARCSAAQQQTLKCAQWKYCWNAQCSRLQWFTVL